MSGSLLAASAYNRIGPSLGNWVDRTPSATLHNNNSVISFVNFGGEIYSMFARFSAGTCRILKTGDFGQIWTRMTNAESVIGSSAMSSSFSPQLRVFNGRLVVVNFKKFITSSDGANWGGYDINPSFAPSTLGNVFYNGTNWMAAGTNSSSPPRQIWRSTTGVPASSSDWGTGIVASSTNNFNGNGPNDIVFAFNKWWIVGNAVTSQPSVYESSDGGSTWTANASATTITQNQGILGMNRIFFINNTLFMISRNAGETRYIYSTDGVNFTQGTFNFTSSTVWAITYSALLNRYAAISDNNLGYSTNGTTWTADESLSTVWSQSPIVGRSIEWMGTGYLAGNGAGQVAWQPMI